MLTEMSHPHQIECSPRYHNLKSSLVLQEENMVSNAELREKYASVEDYEDDFM